jgi:hypothetical protein
VFGYLRRRSDGYFVYYNLNHTSWRQWITIIYLAVSHLHSLQLLLANIPFYSLTVFITHLTSSHIHTSRVCLLSRTYCLELTLKTDFLDIPVSLIKPSIVQTSLLPGRGVYRSVSQQRARWGVCVTSLAETRRSHDIPLFLVPCDVLAACPVSHVTFQYCCVTSSRLRGSLVYRLVIRSGLRNPTMGWHVTIF